MSSVEFHADCAINHLGNLNLLLRMVDKAKWAGCDAIKIQRKEVSSFYLQEKLACPVKCQAPGSCGGSCNKLLPYGRTYGEYRSAFEFDMDQLEIFDRACKQAGLPWYATIQDEVGLTMFEAFDLPMYKVPSCDARNKPFLELIHEVLPKDKLIVMSVAGSTLSEIANSLEIFSGRRMYLLHCIAEYPSYDEGVRLGNIPILEREFGSDLITIGYSGHEEGIQASLGAVDIGAKVVNRHFILVRTDLLERTECALEPEEFKTLIDKVHQGKLEYDLPVKAFDSWFGMTKVESRFLKDQEYKGLHDG